MSGVNPSDSNPVVNSLAGSQNTRATNRNIAPSEVNSAMNILSTVNPLLTTAVTFIRSSLENKVAKGAITPTQAQATGDLAVAKLKSGDMNFGSNEPQPLNEG